MRQEKKIRRRLMPLFLLTMLLSVLFGMNAMAASKTVTMKKSSGVYVYQQNRGYTGTIYHKFTVPTSGVLAVSGNKVYSWGRGGMDVTVCNSKKKALTYRESVNASGDRYLTYGIQKGTYYLKTSGNASYILAAGFQKMADRGAASKSKAYAISQKRVITGVIPIGRVPIKQTGSGSRSEEIKSFMWILIPNAVVKFASSSMDRAQKTDAQSQLLPTVKEPTTLAMREQESQSD